MSQYLSALGRLSNTYTEGVTYHRTTCPDCDFKSHHCERAIDAENEYHEHKCAAEERGKLECLLEWKRRAEANEADMMKLGWAPPLKSERWEALVRECAEWQRRAEAAEAKLALFEAGDTVVQDLCVSFMPWNAEAVAAADISKYEAGPGIAAVKPDNSVAFLDEDLLCEDA